MVDKGVHVLHLLENSLLWCTFDSAFTPQLEFSGVSLVGVDVGVLKLENIRPQEGQILIGDNEPRWGN